LPEVSSYTFDEMQVGMEVSFEHTFSLEDLDSFIRLSGDCSPIHTSDAEAKNRGLQSRVLHGLMVSSLYSTLVGVHLPGRHSLFLGCNIDFHLPVYALEQLRVVGRVKEKHEAYRLVHLKAEIFGPEGSKRSKATLKAQLHA
jgi:3-hydroxybutyryl-CoA dehydratase